MLLYKTTGWRERERQDALQAIFGDAPCLPDGTPRWRSQEDKPAVRRGRVTLAGQSDCAKESVG